MGMGVSQLCAECFNSDDAERKHQLSTKLHDDPLLQNAFDPLDPLGLAQDEPTREPGLLETAHNPVVAGANPSPPKSSRKAEDDTDESDQTTTGTSSFFTDEDDLARPSMSPDDLPRPTHADASGHDLVEVALDGDADGFADAGGGDAKQSLEVRTRSPLVGRRFELGDIPNFHKIHGEAHGARAAASAEAKQDNRTISSAQDHDNDEDDEEQIIVFGGNGGGDSSNPPAAAQAPVRKPSLTMQSSISLTVESETPNTSSQPLVAPAFSSNPFDDDDVPYDNTPDFMNDEPLTRVSSGNPFDDGPDLIGLTEDAFAPATDEKGSRHVSFAEQTEIIVGGVDGEGADNGFGADVNKEEQFGASGGFAEEAEKNDFEIVRETLHERFAEVEARHPDKRRSSINSIGDGEIEFLHRAAGADDHDDLVSERDSEAMVVPVVGEGLPYADINVDELNRKNEDDVLRKRIERGVYFPHPMEHQGSARDGAIDASDDDESIFASVSADPNVDPEEIRQMFPDRNPAQLTAPSFRSNKEDAKGHRKAAKSMWAVHAMRSLEDADPEEGEQDESTPAAPHEEGTPSPPKAPRPSAAELLAMSPPYPVPDGQNPNQAKKARRRVTLAGPEARQIAEEHGGKNPLEELFHDPKAKKVEAEAEPEPEAEEEEEHGEEEDWEYEDEEIPEGSAAEGEMLRSPSKRHRKPRGNKVAQMMGMFDGNST